MLLFDCLLLMQQISFLQATSSWPACSLTIPTTNLTSSRHTAVTYVFLTLSTHHFYRYVPHAVTVYLSQTSILRCTSPLNAKVRPVLVPKCSPVTRLRITLVSHPLRKRKRTGLDIREISTEAVLSRTFEGNK